MTPKTYRGPAALRRRIALWLGLTGGLLGLSAGPGLARAAASPRKGDPKAAPAARPEAAGLAQLAGFLRDYRAALVAGDPRFLAEHTAFPLPFAESVYDMEAKARRGQLASVEELLKARAVVLWPEALAVGDAAQLGEALERDELGQILEALGDQQREVGAAADQSRLRVRGEVGPQRGEVGGRGVDATGALAGEADRLAGARELGAEGVLRAGRGDRAGGVADRPVAGAAAQVAAQLVVELPRLAQVAAVARLEHRHHHPGRAVAALRAELADQRLLDRVVLAGPLAQPLDRVHAPALDHRQQDQARVDRPVRRPRGPVRVEDRHAAGPAVALGAALFGAGAVHILAQPVEQRAMRVDTGQLNQ
mgnify:CR=1 FL=1